MATKGKLGARLCSGLLALFAGSALAQAPDAPVIGNAFAGDARAYVAFTAPGSAGGSPVTAFVATCNPGAGSPVTGSGQTSPIAVNGLANGTPYNCSVTATNASGTSTASGSVAVTPMAGAPLTLIGVVSRKTHGGAVFDLPINPAVPIGGAISVEPRAAGGSHGIVFQFNATITSVGPVVASDEASVLFAASAAPAAHEVVVSLAGIADGKRVSLALPSVNGVASSASASLGFLFGDIDASHAIGAADVDGVKARAGQPGTAATFRFDVHASGAVTAADIVAVKARAGRTLAAVQPPVVAKVTIEQTGLLLTQLGATRQLHAIATDALERALDVPINWASGKPANVSVSSTGLVAATSANGSSQVVASAAGVSSAPLLVVVTQPVAGAVLLTDPQIVGEPFETTPGAVPSLSNTYQVRLGSGPPPAINAIVINTESKAVAGRVVAVDTVSNPMVVTLALVSLPDMFPTLNVDETIDLANAPISIPAGLAADYDFTRTGNRFVFTPKIATAASRKSGATGTRALPPFTSCEATVTGLGDEAPLPFALSVAPKFEVTINPTFDFKYTPFIGIERFIVNAQPAIKIESGISVTAAFEGKVACSAELFIFRVPVGGPLSLVLGGLITVGGGIEAGGKVTLATMGMGAIAEVTANSQFGLSCDVGDSAPKLTKSGGSCSFVRSLDGFQTQLTPTLDAPSLADLRLEPTLEAFGTVEAAFGNPFLTSLRFDFIKAKAGAKLAGSFATKAGQLADPAYHSGYKVSLEAGISAGAQLDSVLGLLDVTPFTFLDATVSTDVAQSPAAATAGPVTADKNTFASGETVTFTVRLDPATVEFFPGIGPYNVKKVQLVRTIAGTSTVVDSIDAVPGESTFTFTHIATDAGTAAQFSAFVVTWLVPLDVLALEVETATSLGTVGVVSSRLRFFIGVCPINSGVYNDVYGPPNQPLPFTLTSGAATLNVRETTPNTFKVEISATFPPMAVCDESFHSASAAATNLQLLVNPPFAGTLVLDRYVPAGNGAMQIWSTEVYEMAPGVPIALHTGHDGTGWVGIANGNPSQSLTVTNAPMAVFTLVPAP